jgi:hypothetical protein
MKRRKIDPETKMAAVLEGLKGESSVIGNGQQKRRAITGFAHLGLR